MNEHLTISEYIEFKAKQGIILTPQNVSNALRRSDWRKPIDGIKTDNGKRAPKYTHVILNERAIAWKPQVRGKGTSEIWPNKKLLKKYQLI